MKPNTVEAPTQSGWPVLHGIPEGAIALVLAERIKQSPGMHVHVCHSDRDMEKLRRLCRFFLPDVEVLTLPAWDCLPYDRVSPHSDVMAERVVALAKLASPPLEGGRTSAASRGGYRKLYPPRFALRYRLRSAAPPQGGGGGHRLSATPPHPAFY